MASFISSIVGWPWRRSGQADTPAIISQQREGTVGGSGSPVNNHQAMSTPYNVRFSQPEAEEFYDVEEGSEQSSAPPMVATDYTQAPRPGVRLHQQADQDWSPSPVWPEGPRRSPSRVEEPPRSPPRRRKAKSPTRYNGKSDLKAFLGQFQMVAKWNEWEYEEMGMQLGISLVDDAREVLVSVPNGLEDDYETLVSELTRRFDPEGRESLFVLKLMDRKQQKAEDVLSYSEAMKELARRAYPNQRLEEKFLTDLFINGLKNPQMQTHLHLNQPSNFAKATNMAITYESCCKRESHGDSREPGRSAEHYNKPRPATCAPVQTKLPGQDQNPPEGLESLLRQYGETLKLVAGKVESLEKQRSTPRTQPRPRRDIAQVKCFRCGEKGHYASTCSAPQGEQGMPPRSAGRAGGGPPAGPALN